MPAPQAQSEAEVAVAAPTPDAERRERGKGWLAGLPPVPEAVRVDIPGWTPRNAFMLWLALAFGILFVGMGLNWVLTGGLWAPPTDYVVDSEAALGDTPVQFITSHPFDVLTVTLFVGSVIVLAVSLVTPHRDGRAGAFPYLAGGFLAAGLAYGAALLAARHYGNASPFFAGAAGPVILALFLATAAALFLIGRNRDALSARRHPIRAAGWTVFAFHWAVTGMYYYVVGGGDWVNMVFAYAAVFLLTYFAYQEFVSRTLGEDNRSLRFLAGAIVIAATVWFAFLRVEFLSKWIIETVAWHTVVVLQALGHDVTIGTDGRTGFTSAISYAETLYPRTVIIILACTAIQSMMIFVAAALAVDGAPWRRRLATIAVVAPIVYVLNLLRNTGIIIMWADLWLERHITGLVVFTHGLMGPDATMSDAAFSIAHNWIGKGGSLIALVLIAILVFRLMPEVLRALVGVLDLPKRRGPIEQHYRALRGLEDEKPTAPATA